MPDSYECAGLLLCKHLAHYPDEEGKSGKRSHSMAFNAESCRLTKYVPAHILAPFSENHSTKMYRNIKEQKRDKILQYILFIALNLLHQSNLKQLDSLVTASVINDKI